MKELRFGPPPAKSFDAAPTPSDVKFFEANGYLVVERITTDEEIEWMRQIFEYSAPGIALTAAATLSTSKPKTNRPGRRGRASMSGAPRPSASGNSIISRRTGS